MTFTDEEGRPRQFTWRTISHLAVPLPKARRHRHGKQIPLRQGQDPQGHTWRTFWKPSQAVLPKVHGQAPKRSVLYRLCIEQGCLEPLAGGPQHLLPHRQAVRVAQTRDPDLATSIAWPSPRPTPMKCGRPTPSTALMSKSRACRSRPASSPSWTTPRGSVATASSSRPRMSIRSSRLSARPFTNGACPPRCTWTTAPSTPPRKSSKSAPGSAACWPTRRCGMARPKEKWSASFRTVRDQFLSLQLDLSSLEALNRQFTHWVEEQYNAQLHSVLGMSSAGPLRPGPQPRPLPAAQ